MVPLVDANVYGLFPFVDMFAELSFSLKKIDVNDDINLYKPVAANEELQRNEKLTFGQLEVELGKKITAFLL